MSLQGNRLLRIPLGDAPIRSIPVKAYIEPDSEIRRFNLDENTTYDELKLRVTQMVRTEEFRMFWKDSENDLIVCGSDEELGDAKASRKGDDPLRLYIRRGQVPRGQPSNDNKAVHRHVTCDGCEGEVAGTRYKCLECEDYDLCEKCQPRGIHAEHDMLAIRVPRTHEWKKLFGQGYGSREGRKRRHHHCREDRDDEEPPASGTPCGFENRRHMKKFMKKMAKLGANRDQTVEMDINMNRPMEEIIADVSKNLRDAMQKAKASFETVGPFPAGSGYGGFASNYLNNFASGSSGNRMDTDSASSNVELKKRNSESDDRSTKMKKMNQEVDDTSAELKKMVVSESQHQETISTFQEPIAMMTETALKSDETFESLDDTISVSDDGESGWTHLKDDEKDKSKNSVVDERETKVEQPNEKREPTGDERIEAALRAMEEMGFPNEGNLLRRLLVNYNGDISRVLDSIK